jgi:hypothetical protein
MSHFDYRARLKPKPDGMSYVFGEDEDSNLLKPLIDQGRALVFPYTPTVLFSGNAEYDEYGFTHSIYPTKSYVKSAPSEIQLTADFTSQTDHEAAHTLACIQFFKSVTKSYFGGQTESAIDRAGTPPPVILFDYMGEFMFKDIPVVVSNYSFTLEPDVDYVPVTYRRNGASRDLATYVPTRMNIAVTLEIVYNTKVVRDKFDLDKFRKGGYVYSGKGRNGGFI